MEINSLTATCATCMNRLMNQNCDCAARYNTSEYTFTCGDMNILHMHDGHIKW